MLIIWCLWKERNARLFDHKSALPWELLDKVKAEIQFWVQAGAARLEQGLCSQPTAGGNKGHVSLAR